MQESRIREIARQSLKRRRPSGKERAVPATATVASATTAAAPIVAPVASSGPSSATKEDPATAFKADNLPALTLEDEAAKRKARAAKWGTTYVEPTVAGPSTTENKSPSTAKNLSAEELERRKAREARFGVARAQAAPVLDEEEMKKRKAREDRFGANKKPRIE
ncbi:hypothetical protein FRC17_001626 [Serendipita sp. 399]|nr:hypothetical protein FRC17_001626 [Serendipita sp. 399]